MSSVPTRSSARTGIVALPNVGPAELHGEMPAGEAALVVLRPAIARFLAYEPSVRRGDDPEAVHDMRVAARRIRTAIKIFGPALPGWTDRVREEIRWIASALGEIRDLDVQRGSLSSTIEELAPEDRAVVHALVDVLMGGRREAQERLMVAMDSVRFERLRGALLTLARGPSLGSDEALRPIAAMAPEVVAARYRKLRRAGKRLGSDSPSEDLHALRIRCKRARYSVEFFLPLYDKPAGSLVSRLAQLQHLLGELHDAEVAAERFQTLAHDGVEHLPDNAGFVLGRLAERAAQRARKLRRRFPDRFASIRGSRWKDLKRAMLAEAG